MLPGESKEYLSLEALVEGEEYLQTCAFCFLSPSSLSSSSSSSPFPPSSPSSSSTASCSPSPSFSFHFQITFSLSFLHLIQRPCPGSPYRILTYPPDEEGNEKENLRRLQMTNSGGRKRATSINYAVVAEQEMETNDNSPEKDGEIPRSMSTL